MTNAGELSLRSRAKMETDHLHRAVYQMGAMYGLRYEEMDWEGLIGRAEARAREHPDAAIDLLRRTIRKRGRDPKCQQRKLLYVGSLLRAGWVIRERIPDCIGGWPLATLIRDEPIDMIEPDFLTRVDVVRLMRQLEGVASRLTERGCEYCGGEAYPARASCPNCGAPT